MYANSPKFSCLKGNLGPGTRWRRQILDRKWKYVSRMRNASGHNYWNSSFIMDVAMGQIPRFTERISSLKWNNFCKWKQDENWCIKIATALRCSRWNLLIFIHYLCNVFISERERSLYVVVPPSVCLSSVTFVRPTQTIEIFGNVSMPFGTLAIHDLSVTILRRSSQGNPSVWGVKHKRGSRI